MVSPSTSSGRTDTHEVWRVTPIYYVYRYVTKSNFFWRARDGQEREAPDSILPADASACVTGDQIGAPDQSAAGQGESQVVSRLSRLDSPPHRPKRDDRCSASDDPVTVSIIARMFVVSKAPREGKSAERS